MHEVFFSLIEFGSKSKFGSRASRGALCDCVARVSSDCN